MAEPSNPAEETGDGRPGAAPSGPRASEPETELLAPPTEEELAATGEPTLDQVRAAAAGAADDEPAARPDEPTAVLPAAPTTVRAEESGAKPQPTEVVREPAGVRAEEPASATVVQPVAPPPPAAQQQRVLAPAAESAPPPPRLRGNRLVGTAWVLLAAGLFQLLYFGALALFILLLSGVNAVGPGITNVARYPFGWLPVLFFFLFFELTVLLLNRAGKFAYVVASLIVGLLVYIVSVLLISILVGGGIGDTPTLARAFEAPEFVLTGLVAREVMLWTGFAIGSRGIRVRNRNREARERYDRESADVRD